MLAHLLRQPEMAGVAVVAAQPDPPVWWSGGCPCCAPRDDVARALRAMLPRVRRDEVRRVVIETTGLADPGPILATLLSDTVAASAYRLDAIVTVVDAVNGAAALDTRDMAVRQIAVADRIVLSKTDLADPPDLRARLWRLNPGASIAAGRHGVVDPSFVPSAGPFDLLGETPDMRAWQDPTAFAAAADAEHSLAPTGRDGHIQAFRLTFDRPLSWPNVSTSLERLVLTHGDAVLRMKGILRLRGQEHPVAIHSARHLLFPPVRLASWPAGDPANSRLAFITRDLPRAALEAALPILAGAAAEAE
jgi:G3E family GTPase